MSVIEDFVMPDVGEGIAEAEVVEWLVAVGDSVTIDQAVAVVETDKSQVELPTPFAGVVATLHAEVGDIIKVGTPLISVKADATSAPATTVIEPEAPIDSAAAVIAAAPAASAWRPGPVASPSTRRLAVTLGVDLAQVTPTGPHGRIQAADVRAAAEGEQAPTAAATGHDDLTAAAPAPTRSPRHIARNTQDVVVPVRGLRRQIARTMTQSLQIPHVTEFREIDASKLLAARSFLKPRFDQDGLPLSVLPFLVKATARALTRHPSFNATYDSGLEEITQYAAVHIGIATATEDGLIVPTLRDADQLSLREIGTEIDRLAELARTRKASPDQLSGAGFTITNFGSFGTWLGTPVIRHPEVAIAGFGRIEDKVIPILGQPTVRPVLPIAVAADHRINDGVHLGALVTDIADALVDPLLLLD